MQDADYLVFKSIAKILIRKGIISPTDVELEVEELARISSDASHNLSMLLMEAQSMTASEFAADYRRRQMRERTEWLERQRNGGKSED